MVFAENGSGVVCSTKYVPNGSVFCSGQIILFQLCIELV